MCYGKKVFGEFGEKRKQASQKEKKYQTLAEN
jgi:hypothetical protein